MAKIKASIRGQKQGLIWMPCTTHTKEFVVSERDFNYADGSRPSLRDMAERATNDGDFQGTDITFGYLVLEMTTRRKDGSGKKTITREHDLRRFPSIADMMVKEGDEVYPDIPE